MIPDRLAVVNFEMNVRTERNKRKKVELRWTTLPNLLYNKCALCPNLLDILISLTVSCFDVHAYPPILSVKVSMSLTISTLLRLPLVVVSRLAIFENDPTTTNPANP